MKTRWLINFRLMVLLTVIALTTNACRKNPSLSPAAVKQQQLDWNLKTLVAAYQNHGNTDAKWDEPVIRALTEFARARAGIREANESWNEIISTNVAAAIQAGCDDPMVSYLFIRYALAQTNNAKTFADSFCKTALDMEKSSYPNIRKFYADAAAVDQLFYAYNTNLLEQPTARQVESLLGQNITLALEDKTMPAEEAYESAERALSLIGGNAGPYQQAYDCIEKPLFENWPNASSSWLLKGSSHIQMAWNARGSGYANTVSDEGWKSYQEHLKTADKALTKAWQLNPNDTRIAIQMMKLELGQGQGRDRMELWFHRAMALDTNCYDACSAKLYYLEPKWYGSTDAMLEFGRECVTNQAWGGHIPLILLDAHKSIQRQYVDDSAKADYWKQPTVWADLKAAFDRFFELNPNEISWYHDYAWYAYQAKQWDTLNQIIPKLGPVNYNYFGGKDEFDKMVQLAQEHASNSK